MKNVMGMAIETSGTEEDDPQQDEDWELTEEELERLDKELEETYRTGKTPLLDALLPGKDWTNEGLLEIYHMEVERQLRSRGAVAEDIHSAFFHRHVERSFGRARSAAQCAEEWLVSMN